MSNISNTLKKELEMNLDILDMYEEYLSKDLIELLVEDYKETSNKNIDIIIEEEKPKRILNLRR